MSYASVASHNTIPIDQQAQPDPSLLNTDRPRSHLVDDTSKVNMAPSDFKQHPHTVTSEADVIDQYPESNTAPKSSSNSHSKRVKAKKHLENAEEEGEYLWAKLREQLLRPGVAGGLIGIVNVGLIASAGYAFYSRPSYRSDTKIIGSTVAGALLLLGTEGYFAEGYANTDQGRLEAQRAREEGGYLYRQAKEVVLRPGVLGGIVGVFNLAVLGTVGYFAYENWDLPRWDRRTVSAVTVGLLGLSLGEGYLGEEYKEKEYPKRK